MKRLSGIVLLAVLLLLPEGIYAERPGIISFIVDPLEYTDLGDTEVLKSREGAVRIRTTGLVGEGEINCNDNENCIAAFPVGGTFNIRQDLHLELRQFDKDSTIENDLRGRTMGTVSIVVDGYDTIFRNFKGRIKGYALAADFDEDGDVDGADFIMNITARAKRGGKVELQLHGVIREVVPEGLRGEWESLEANVVLKIPGR